MKKIPTIFIRNPDKPVELLPQINPVCDWVFHGHGVPTRKYDGIALMLKSDGDGFARPFLRSWWKRYDCKKGRQTPFFFVPADDPDPITGHWPGWVPVTEGSEDQWIRTATKNILLSDVITHLDNCDQVLEEGTYEAIGPHFQGNPESMVMDCVIRHGVVPIDFGIRPSSVMDQERTPMERLIDYFRCHDLEGIVWYHPDGRMAKIKGRDFGIKRGK